jgi:hypothetical protein
MPVATDNKAGRHEKQSWSVEADLQLRHILQLEGRDLNHSPNSAHGHPLFMRPTKER